MSRYRPSNEFQPFEAANPAIWLPAQSATARISLQCASTGRKIAPNSPQSGECRIMDQRPGNSRNVGQREENEEAFARLDGILGSRRTQPAAHAAPIVFDYTGSLVSFT